MGEKEVTSGVVKVITCETTLEVIENMEDQSPWETINAQKKMAKKYVPSKVEQVWYPIWESSGYFKADCKNTKPPFVMVLPPPNSTGMLDMSHVLTVAIQDGIVRWRRMSGDNVIWVPGVDVAEGSTCKDLYCDRILTQLQRLGASFDWSINADTMAAYKLHEDQLVYRGFGHVNYDCTLQTTIPDIEVNGQEKTAIDPLEVVINGMVKKDLLNHVQKGALDLDRLHIDTDYLDKHPKGIPECGTDALRFSLFSCDDEENRWKLDTNRIVQFREWCSKMWNLVSCVVDKLSDYHIPSSMEISLMEISLMPPICRWILSSLSRTVDCVISSMEAQKFSDATSAIYSWWQHDLRNVFIEAIELYFMNSQESDLARVKDTIWICLDMGLRLLHPFMPCLTEELWQRLPQPEDRKGSIMNSRYPSTVKEWLDGELESEIGIVLKAVKKIKSLKPKSTSNKSFSYSPIGFVHCKGKQILATIQRHQPLMKVLACADVKILEEDDPLPSCNAAGAVMDDLDVYVRFHDDWTVKAAKVLLEYLKQDEDEAEKEKKPDINAVGHAPPFTPDQGSDIEKHFLAFLSGYTSYGESFYKIVWPVLVHSRIGELSICFNHLKKFDPVLANTIHYHFDSVKPYITNAAKCFVEDVLELTWKNPVLTISDRPTPCSFMTLKDFWGSPGRQPAEECDIYCGDDGILKVTRTTPAGRIVLSNLLKKIFSSYRKKSSWNGNWTIADVMVCTETYAVEIIKPFSDECNQQTLLQDLLVVAESAIPMFSCGGQMPAFFGHLEYTLRRFNIDGGDVELRKFQKFVTAHFALKAPLVRSNFLDHIHEMLQTLGPKAQKVLETILKSEQVNWISDLKSREINPVLAVVSDHNLIKNEKVVMDREKKKKDNKNGGTSRNQGAKDVGLNMEKDAKFAFHNTYEGLLVYARHIKQHGSRGGRNASNEQKLMQLSEIDLVMSHFLPDLANLLKILIDRVDDPEVCKEPKEYCKYLVMLLEVFKAFDTPESIPK